MSKSKRVRKPKPGTLSRFHLMNFLPAALTAVAVLGLLGWMSNASEPPSDVSETPAVASQQRFDGSAEEVENLIELNRSIHLTAAQVEIQEEALDSIPAPCCAEYSAATCCCDCNLARAIWGLSKRQIVERGAGAEETRSAVETWLATVYPAGFTGDACHTGGCGRSMKNDGCGGMSEDRLVF